MEIKGIKIPITTPCSVSFDKGKNWCEAEFYGVFPTRPTDPFGGSVALVRIDERIYKVQVDYVRFKKKKRYCCFRRHDWI